MNVRFQQTMDKYRIKNKQNFSCLQNRTLFSEIINGNAVSISAARTWYKVLFA